MFWAGDGLSCLACFSQKPCLSTCKMFHLPPLGFAHIFEPKGSLCKKRGTGLSISLGDTVSLSYITKLDRGPGQASKAVDTS